MLLAMVLARGVALCDAVLSGWGLTRKLLVLITGSELGHSPPPPPTPHTHTQVQVAMRTSACMCAYTLVLVYSTAYMRVACSACANYMPVHGIVEVGGVSLVLVVDVTPPAGACPCPLTARPVPITARPLMPAAGYETCQIRLVRVLERLTRERERIPPEYLYYGIPSPWLQVWGACACRAVPVGSRAVELRLAGRRRLWHTATRTRCPCMHHKQPQSTQVRHGSLPVATPRDGTSKAAAHGACTVIKCKRQRAASDRARVNPRRLQARCVRALQMFSSPPDAPAERAALHAILATIIATSE